MISLKTSRIIRHQLKPFVELGMVDRSEAEEVEKALSSYRHGGANPGLLTKEDVANLLKISEKTVESYVNKGILKPFKIKSPEGGREWIRFNKSEILSFIGYSEDQILNFLRAE